MLYKTTDIYFAAYLKAYMVNVNDLISEYSKRKVGDKIIFEFDMNKGDPDELYEEFLNNGFIQSFILGIKETRSDIYKTMRQ